MGKILGGGAKVSGQAPLMTREQQDFLAQTLRGVGPQAAETYQEFLQPYAPGQYEELFQRSFIDPAMRTYEEQVLPAIQQRFVDVGAGSSSALGQALGQSAADISALLGSQMGQFTQAEQARQDAQRLQTLQLLNQMMGARAQEPIIQQRQGILGPLLGAGAQIGSAFIGRPRI